MSLETIKKQQDASIKRTEKLSSIIPILKKFDARRIEDLIGGEPGGVTLYWSRYTDAYDFTFYYGRLVPSDHDGIITQLFSVACGSVIGLNIYIQVQIYPFNISLADNDSLLIYVEERSSNRGFQRVIEIPAIPICVSCDDKIYNCFWTSDSDYKKIAEAGIKLLSGQKLKSEFEFESGENNKNTLSGCFVITACYDGNENHPDLVVFRDIRDNLLGKTKVGKKFISLYYKYGPRLAEIVKRLSSLKKLLRFMFVIIAKLIRTIKNY